MDRRLPREMLTAAEHLARHKRGRPFKVAADSEVRAFVDSCLATMPFQGVVDAARARFGRDRGPSYGALYRYWTALPSAERDRIRAAALKSDGS